MKNITILFALTTSAMFTAIACGDSDDSTGGKGGSSGSAGNAGSAGTPATGGTGGTPGTGGSAGTPATGGSGGAAPTGGTAGTGADGGVGAEGGMGMGGVGDGGTGPGMGCPMNQPMGMNLACTTRGLSCDFGDTVCRCGLMAGTWICNDENPDCPAMPEPGGDCMGMGTACSYGDQGTCLCQNPAGPPPTTEWVCDDGVVMCPENPMDGSSCTMFPAGTECGDCTCGIGMGREWNCGGGGGMCPMMQPDDGDACMMPGNICMFDSPGPGGEATCICNTMSEWTCI